MNLIASLKIEKKTEIIAIVKKVSPNTQILFSDVFNIGLKKNKRTQFNFQVQQDAPEGGQVKGKSIKVPPGLGKDAYPDIKEPVRVEHTRTTGGYGGGGNRQMDIPPQNNQPPPPGRIRLPPPSRRVPPPSNDDGDNGTDNQDDAPPPTRRIPPGRLPGRGGLPMPGMRGPPPM